ncbi:MAG TPA: MBL fold metallo-hydrolase [Bradyrhizobium sp.]|nr:MBL fold metallo-hydrolase [Bradyrhizobium sp.]
MTEITRRRLIGTAMAAGASGSLAAGEARAAAPPSNQQVPGLYRYKVGVFELTALYDGVWHRPIDDRFVRNADFGDVRKALSDAFMPADKLATPFTTLLVNTGSKLVLLDTGTGGQIAPTAGTLEANLAAAGIDPKAIDQIVISHFHPDHINGIKDRHGKLIFPNAEILVPESEWAYWMNEANISAAPPGLKLSFLNFRRVFSNIARDVTRFQPGSEVASGISTIAAPGHTPGHTVFTIQSGSESMMVLSDTTQHPAIFARHPEWQPIFDMDGEVAVGTRKKLLDRAATDRMLVTGYHFPFPACGHIVKTTTGYDHVPALWQPTL